MPIYEFECEDCGTGFDEMAPVGTEHGTCPECGSQNTVRRFSAPATFRLVKTPGDARQQEIRNAKLNADTKANFKERRQQAREARRKASGQGGSSS